MPGHKRWRADRNAWELIVPLPRSATTGRRRDRSQLFRGSERDADRALARLFVATEVEHVTRDATVEQLLARWMDLVEADLSPTTVREYRRVIRARIVPAIGAVAIGDLGPERLDAFYRGMVAGGLSPSSVVRIHAVIRRALSQAVKWGWLDSNPAARATTPRARAKRHELPPLDVVIGLIEKAAADDEDFGLLARVAAATGMRRGELVGLRWSKITLKPPSILVDAAVVDVAGRLMEREPKWQSRRRVSLDDATALLLELHLERVHERAGLGCTTLLPGAFVWSLDLDGARPIRPEMVTARWRRLCRAQGVACRFHDLRHFSASQLIAAGVDVRTVAGRLGHANPSTTLSIYAHAFEARDVGAAQLLGGLLDGGAAGRRLQP